MTQDANEVEGAGHGHSASASVRAHTTVYMLGQVSIFSLSPELLGPSPRRMNCASGHVLRSASKIAMVLCEAGPTVRQRCTYNCRLSDLTHLSLGQPTSNTVVGHCNAFVHSSTQQSQQVWCACCQIQPRRGAMTVAVHVTFWPSQCRCWGPRVCNTITGTLRGKPGSNQRRVCWQAVVAGIADTGRKIICTLQSMGRDDTPAATMQRHTTMHHKWYPALRSPLMHMQSSLPCRGANACDVQVTLWAAQNALIRMTT